MSESPQRGLSPPSGARRWIAWARSSQHDGLLLLMIGYPLALGVLARLRPVLAERCVWWFAALEAATASITAGWLLHRRPVPAAVNCAALVGLAIAWFITGQRAGRRGRKAH